MKTRFVALFLALLVAATGLAPTASAEGYRAPRGPEFNNPLGGDEGRFRIERKIVGAIKAAKKKTTIRIAIYSLDRIPVANALVAAHQRGVRVQILLNDHQDTRAMKILRARLGTNPKKNNFIYKCRSSCRGVLPDRNLHTKFYLFDKAGKSENVLMLGSANLTLNAVKFQWNDLWMTSGKPALYANFVALFDDMRNDYSANQPAYQFCDKPLGEACDENTDTLVNRVFPKRSTIDSDVILDYLNKIRCLTPTPDGGVRRTQLALSMHTIRGARGLYLADKMRQMYAAGCDFRVNYGIIGFQAKQRLGAPTARGRIPLRSTGYDYDADEIIDRYTHQKYFVVRGNFAGNPDAAITMTGSSNWASLGTAQDEIIFTVRGAGVARKYMANFNLMWSPRYSRNAYTTTYSVFRTLRTVKGDDGVSRRVTTTRRVPVTTVLPDRLSTAGPTWEND